MRSNAMLKHIFLCINIILLSFYILTSFAYTTEENVRENYYKAGKCLGDYYLTNDDAYLEKGLLLINKAIEDDDAFLLSYYLKAEILGKLKKYREGILVLTDVLNKKANEDSIHIAMLFQMRGLLNQKINNMEEAFENYNKALNIYKSKLKIQSENKILIANIAQILILSNKREESELFIDNLIKKNPGKNWIIDLKKDLKTFSSDYYLEKF